MFRFILLIFISNYCYGKECKNILLNDFEIISYLSKASEEILFNKSAILNILNMPSDNYDNLVSLLNKSQIKFIRQNGISFIKLMEDHKLNTHQNGIEITSLIEYASKIINNEFRGYVTFEKVLNKNKEIIIFIDHDIIKRTMLSILMILSIENFNLDFNTIEIKTFINEKDEFIIMFKNKHEEKDINISFRFRNNSTSYLKELIIDSSNNIIKFHDGFLQVDTFINSKVISLGFPITRYTEMQY